MIMTGIMRAPRSRGSLSGLLLVLLGLWGGLLPFIGPYFGFGFRPDDTWVYNTDRLQLSILPAAAMVLGGLILLFAANRVIAMVGGWLAALAGAWFVVGTTIARLWDVTGIGGPLGSTEGQRVAELTSGFLGLGVIAAFLAGLALGRFAVIGARESRRKLPPPDEPGQTGASKPPPVVYGRYAQENRRPAHARSSGERHAAGDRRDEP
jgi:hypothetical protein